MGLFDVDALKNYVKKRLTNQSELLLDQLCVRITDTTVDMVEVVRCKDCKHYDGSWFCDINGVPSRKHDDFCSYGERKEQ